MNRRPASPTPLTLLRLARGLTLRALAQQVGVVPEHLGRVARGERCASDALVVNLARVLGVPPRILESHLKDERRTFPGPASKEGVGHVDGPEEE